MAIESSWLEVRSTKYKGRSTSYKVEPTSTFVLRTYRTYCGLGCVAGGWTTAGFATFFFAGFLAGVRSLSSITLRGTLACAVAGCVRRRTGSESLNGARCDTQCA